MASTGPRSKGAHDDDGAAAVEFAIVSVLLFTLVFGIVQYALGLYQLQAAAATARDAARLTAVGVDSAAALGGRVACIADQNGISASDVRTVSISAPVAGILKVGDQVTVTVTYRPIRLNFPFVPYPGGDGNGDFSAKATSRIEQVGLLNTISTISRPGGGWGAC